MLSRRAILAAASSTAILFIVTGAHAGKLNAGADRIGISGYDPVAYFTDNAAVKGRRGLDAVHDGVTYRFANAANRNRFAANPSRYAPQFGGFCAYAVANGYTAKIDPEAFSVVDGRLYLNYSKRVRSLWSKDIPGHIARGDANWPQLSRE